MPVGELGPQNNGVYEAPGAGGGVGGSLSEFEKLARQAKEHEIGHQIERSELILQLGNTDEVLEEMRVEAFKAMEDPNSEFENVWLYEIAREAVGVEKRAMKLQKPVAELYASSHPVARTLTSEDIRQHGINRQEANDGVQGWQLFPGYAISSREVTIRIPSQEVETTDENGKKVKQVFYQIAPASIGYFGVDSERTEVSKKLEMVVNEMKSRYRLHELYSNMMQASGSLKSMTEIFFTGLMYKMLPYDLMSVFRAPNIGEFEARTETEAGFGKRVDKCLRMIVLSCRSEDVVKIRNLKWIDPNNHNPSKTREELMAPGWLEIFPTTADEKKWLGDVDAWESVENANFYQEIEDGRRTGFGVVGNIFNAGRTPRNWDEYKDLMVELAEGDRAAVELALRYGKTMCIIQEEGGSGDWERIEKDDPGKGEVRGKYKDKANEIGNPVTDILAQVFNPRRYWETQAGKYPSPVERAIPDIPNFLANYLKMTTFLTDKDNPNSEVSLWEAWWYGITDSRAGGKVINPSTGKVVCNMADRYFPWEDVGIYSYRSMWLKIFFAAREAERPSGIMAFLSAKAWEDKAALHPETWKTFRAALDRGVSPLSQTDGIRSVYSSDEIDEMKKDLQKEIVCAAMEAMWLSESDKPWINHSEERAIPGSELKDRRKMTGKEAIIVAQRLANFPFIFRFTIDSSNEGTIEIEEKGKWVTYKKIKL